MTRKEAIIRIKDHMNIHRMYEPRGTKISEAFDMAIKALEEQRWIPVSEKLPEPWVDVIVTNDIGIYIGWIDPEDKGWRVDSESEYIMKDIIAWMPRPKEYRDEQK